MGPQARTKKRTATIVIALAVIAGSALVLRAALRRADDGPEEDAATWAYVRRAFESLGHPEWRYGAFGSTAIIIVTGHGLPAMDACNSIRPQFSAGERLEPPAGLMAECTDEELMAIHWRVPEKPAK